MEIMTPNVTERKRRLVDQDLLPGIPDDTILHEILPKLHWNDFYILASVSRAWCKAIRSGRIFHSRVLSHSIETFVLVYYNRNDHYTRNTIGLYSMRENSWHDLPPIANFVPSMSGIRRDGIPGAAQCISMDGKIYIMGGVVDSVIINTVFVFDLVAQGHWQQCASMKQRRVDFGSAVIDGKIYVFGGRTGTALEVSRSVAGPTFDAYDVSKLTLISGSEVYDPEEDTWSPITPMTIGRFNKHVTPIGEELFVYGRRHLDFSHSNIHRYRGDSLEAYHPLKDEWRVGQGSWNQSNRDELFTVQENVFLIRSGIRSSFGLGYDDRGRLQGLLSSLLLGWDSLAIHKFDFQRNSWIHVHSFSFTALIPVEYRIQLARPGAILAADDELIAVVRCLCKGREALCLLHSTGFGSENHEIFWKLRAITFPQLVDMQQYFVHKL